MKKLIKLSEDHYIIVDDSRKALTNKGGSGYYLGNNHKIYSISDISNKSVIGQITHSTQPLEIIKIPSEVANIQKISWGGIKVLSLSEVEEAINGYSVDKMAKYHYGNHRKTREFEDGFMLGFKIAHKELTKDKLFTVENMRKACDLYRSGKTIDTIIQSLLPKEQAEWDIELVDGKIKLIN